MGMLDLTPRACSVGTTRSHYAYLRILRCRDANFAIVGLQQRPLPSSYVERWQPCKVPVKKLGLAGVVSHDRGRTSFRFRSQRAAMRGIHFGRGAYVSGHLWRENP